MWLSRKILNVSWSNKVTNDEVLRRVDEEKSIISIIKKGQRAWLGHTLRNGDLLHLAIKEEWKEGGLHRDPEWEYWTESRMAALTNL